MNIEEVQHIREQIDITRKEFADYLGLGKEGQKQVKEWEEGNLKVPSKYLKKIDKLTRRPPFEPRAKDAPRFKMIDLFAGIGGIRLPFQELGGECVFTSEWDKFAQKTYRINYGNHSIHGDITDNEIQSQITSHDLLLGGFPCQPFSQAGLKKGFGDTRGTLFFEIQTILAEHKPAAFLLENVKQLKGHDKGNTLKTIVGILTGDPEYTNKFSDKEIDAMQLDEKHKNALKTPLNYHVKYEVLKAYDYGVPQNRERIYIVGFNRDKFPKGFDFSKFFKWPTPVKNKKNLGSILEDNLEVNEKYTISEKLWSGHQRRKKEHINKGNGFGYSLFNRETKYANTISARYYKDGSEILIDQSDIGKRPRRLTPKECSRLQGFPDDFLIPVSDAQAYKQFGNSVAVPVIRAIAKQMLQTLEKGKVVKTKTKKSSKTLH